MTGSMLLFLDILFDALHIVVILFNLTGWIFKVTRRVHRWLVGMTAFCWLVIGPFVGAVGYCPLTEWHWRIKEARGEKHLPGSYIDYLLQGAGFHAAPERIDFATGATFIAVVLATAWAWRKDRQEQKAQRP